MTRQTGSNSRGGSRRRGQGKPKEQPKGFQAGQVRRGHAPKQDEVDQYAGGQKPQRGGHKGNAQKRGGAKGNAQQRGGQQRGQKPRGPRAFAEDRFNDLGPVRRRRRGPSTPVDSGPRKEHSEGERLQKVMANAGVASRRASEEIILAGRVEVNHQIVTELGTRVDPEVDVIHVDGIRLQLDTEKTYLVFNKPAGVVTSMNDPEGRKDISDFLREGQAERLYHVGRLDYETEGLLLLTNDGELAHRLTHPSFEVSKTYLVQIRGPLPDGVGAQMREGIELEDGLAKVDSFRLVDGSGKDLLAEVVLHDGRNRIVRRLFDAVGFPVRRLVRTQIGTITLGQQRQGSVRRLSKTEVGHLLAEVGL